jgi:hypothetical protein
LIFLEYKAYSLLDFLVWKVFKGQRLDIRIGRTVFMREIQGEVFNIPDQDRFLLYKEISVLGHSLINIFLLSSLILHDSFSGKLFILEVLVNLFKIQKL